jgi:chemotaxis protein MotB
MTEKSDTFDEEIEEASTSSAPRRFNRRAGDQQGQSSSMWLISFTDVMALMLTFFVLLFSMSSPDKEDWERIKNNIQENFSVAQGKPLHRSDQDAVNINKINFSRALDLKYLKAIISNITEEQPDLGIVRVMEANKSLIIALPADLVFAVGDAEIRTEANKALFSLAGTLGRIKNRIEVVGHTDPRPISGGEFASNWELSLTRATNVAALLERVGYKKPITVRGQASGRYGDISNSISADERSALSRRVDIVVMEDDGRRLKLFDLGLPSSF